MATILRTPSILLRPAGRRSSPGAPKNLISFSLRQRLTRPSRLKLPHLPGRSVGFPKVISFAAYGEATETNEVEEMTSEEESGAEVSVANEANDGAVVDTEVESLVMASLKSYREALANDDKSRVSEIEAFLQSIEDEKESLENKVAALSEELLVETNRILRISADFDNFRKRTERERHSLMTNVQGEVVEGLLPVLDNFERAKAQIKVETEGEEKINNSYQSIYKQFIEILDTLGVEAVPSVGNAFDPMLHEAIMREDSTEFDEGIIIMEFRKGFKLGDRLLRPAVVKVSAGPGPAKSEVTSGPEEGGDGETSKENSDEGVEAA